MLKGASPEGVERLRTTTDPAPPKKTQEKSVKRAFLAIAGGIGLLWLARFFMQKKGVDTASVGNAVPRSSLQTLAAQVAPMPREAIKEMQLHVDFLGGKDVVNGKAYRLHGESDAMTYDEIVNLIQDRLNGAQPNQKPVLYFRRVGVNPIAENTINVTSMQQWAAQKKIGVVWPNW